MKKLFAIIFMTLLYTQSFAYNILQVVVETETPPTPGGGEGSITPFGGDPGTPSTSSIDFIIPLLLLSVVFLTFYIIKKNRIKTV